MTLHTSFKEEKKKKKALKISNMADIVCRRQCLNPNRIQIKLGAIMGNSKQTNIKEIGHQFMDIYVSLMLLNVKIPEVPNL